MTLYHVDTGFPAGVQPPSGGFTLQYTRHAQTEAHNDKYGQFVLPSYLVLDGSETFELEVTNGVPSKAAIRVRYDEWYDLCLVIVPGSIVGTVLVVTCWLNEWWDTHETLKVGRYVKP